MNTCYVQSETGVQFTHCVRLSRIEHGGGGRDEGEQLGVSPLVGRQIPPGIDHLKTDQCI